MAQNLFDVPSLNSKVRSLTVGPPEGVVEELEPTDRPFGKVRDGNLTKK